MRLSRLSFSVFLFYLLHAVGLVIFFVYVYLTAEIGLRYAVADRRSYYYDSTPKVILLWTGWFMDEKWQEMFKLNENSPIWTSSDYSNDNDNDKKCLLTTDKAFSDNASAVVFHSRNIDFFSVDLVPMIRHQWQRWVFFTLESPVSNGMSDEKFLWANQVKFNWTMTYRPKSDVWFPYGFVRQRRHFPLLGDGEMQRRIGHFVQDFFERPLDGYWAVSHCETQSKREELFEKLLESGLKLEKWGRCSDTTPEAEWDAIGADVFFTKYRFYFAFENALCDDYLTEKSFVGLYHSLKHGLIPVVYGRANYSQVLPEGSYINAFNVPPDQLARLLMELSQGPGEKVAEFYKWHLTHELHYKETNFYIQPNYWLKFGWSSLCQRLWTAPSDKPQFVTDLKRELGQCYEPPFFAKTDNADDYETPKLLEPLDLETQFSDYFQ